MKKLLLLPVLAFFASCSTDDSALEIAQENNLAKSAYAVTNAVNPACLDAVTGSVTADLSQGINNPVFVFTGHFAGVSANATYRTRIEIQAISDCEDVNSGTGTIVQFKAPYATKAPTTQLGIRIALQSLPNFPCYRWRVVVDGTTSIKGKGPCTTTSEWYEAPLI
ncbi:hypothetical protein [uncultured Flavobacterium sp.]|uniref:hypothetical protein n=1 Tax=uncultured Flavobacterium sp. TaxID=165435 RepID=UPI0025D0CFF3|nr:hypothetical protein [uncultured Flavobacterium sp.]